MIGRVADFLRLRLQNTHPQVTAIPARRRGTPFSPDNPAIVAPLLQADLIFLGPGSPTYAVRQLQDSLAWQMLTARHRLGAALALASAAVAAVGAYALPVYEIYKVGEDLHWKAGLDFFGAYGLRLAFVPHWDNVDGGEELDTSRCFMGQSRFARLLEMLPPGVTVIGIDEKTALIVEPDRWRLPGNGQGGRDSAAHRRWAGALLSTRARLPPGRVGRCSKSGSCRRHPPRSMAAGGGSTLPEAGAERPAWPSA